MLEEAFGIHLLHTGSCSFSIYCVGYELFRSIYSVTGAWAGGQDGIRAIKIPYIVEHLQNNQTFYTAKIYSLLNFYCVWLS